MKEKMEIALITLFSALVIGASAQLPGKPWTDWTVNDAQMVLDNSPWAQTQVETSMYTNGGTIIANSSNVRVRLVSAKPIRQAIARIMELNPSKYRPEEIAKAQRFAEFKYDRTIVVGLRSETRNTGLAANDFYPGWMSPAFLRNYYRNVYLEIKGKRIPVQDFQAPVQDGLGVKLIFPRFIDNRPVIDPIAGEVCFHAELSKLIINARFSIAELFYNGVQEY